MRLVLVPPGAAAGSRPGSSSAVPADGALLLPLNPVNFPPLKFSPKLFAAIEDFRVFQNETIFKLKMLLFCGSENGGLGEARLPFSLPHKRNRLAEAAFVIAT